MEELHKMNDIEQLKEYRKKISELSEEEKKQRDIHLKKLSNGEIYGPQTGFASIDRPHLSFYSDDAITSKCPSMSMNDYLFETCKNNMDDVAIVFDAFGSQTEITYRQLDKNIDKVKKMLQFKGVKKGDKVAVSFANVPESLYTIYALNRIGALACLIDPRSTEFNLEQDLKNLNVKLFIGINDTYSLVKKVADKVNLDNMIFVSTLNSSNNKIVKSLYLFRLIKEHNLVLNKDKNWNKLITKSLPEDAIEKVSGNDLAMISFTGGTTGVHKGVMLTNDSINNMVFSHNSLLENLQRGEIFMDILPQFMIYGIFSLHLGLCRGLKTYMVFDASPKNFVNNLKRLNPAIVFGGPIHWETLIDNQELTEGCLSNMKAPVSGGEKLSLAKELEINKSLQKAGSPVEMFNGYGASELGGSVTLKEGSKDMAGTVGRLHVFDDVKIVDPDTYCELTYEQPGKLLIKTPSIMNGYYNRPDEDEKAFYVDEYGNKWFDTGDLALVHRNGDIEITGRIKRLFVCGLCNVYPPAMEELIYTIPEVEKCVVVPVPDEELREVPKVHIVLKEDNEQNRELVIHKIENIIRERINDSVLPKYYEFNKTLKYTLNGKVDFEKIRREDVSKMQNQKTI